MEDPTPILAALAEPTRFKAMQLIYGGQELCLCQLMEALDVTQSRASRHMAALKAAGLVVDRRDAQWVRYKIAPKLHDKTKKILRALYDGAGKGAGRSACCNEGKSKGKTK